MTDAVDSVLNDPVCFIAYSIEDDESVIVRQKLVALLERPLQALGLRLFVDNRIIRGQGEASIEVLQALDSAVHAIVLVGPQFLASSISQSVDIKLLIETVKHRNGRILPILVDYCLWNQFSYLHTEFMNDTERPIVSLAGDKDALSRELSLCAKRILDACANGLPDPNRTGFPAQESRDGQGQPDVVPNARGEFPLLPESIWRRDDLISTVVHTLTQDSASGRLVVQLVGEAGIGKSVLAVIISREDTVRQRYRDGIYWLSAGVSAESYDLLLGLARLLGVQEPLITERDALRVLRAVLKNRRVLVIVDDLVSRDQIEALSVLGQGSALLTTGRREATGAHSLVIPVPRLSSSQAKEYLEFQPAGALSHDEEGLLMSLAKGVPLALSIGCAVLATASDRTLAMTLLERDDFGDHPFADSFRSVSAAMATLKAHEQDLVKALAVYPAGSGIPIIEVSRWWRWLAGTPHEDASTLLKELARLKLANVVHGDSEEGVRIQAIVQAYLTFMADEPLSVLHAAWTRSHNSGRDGAWRLSDVSLDDQYYWTFAPFHLRMAGRWTASVALDPAFMISRACIGGVETVLRDLSSVLGETSRESKVAAAAHRELQRYAHLSRELNGADEWGASLKVWIEHTIRRPNRGLTGPWSAPVGWPGVPPVGATTLVEHSHWVTGVSWLGPDKLVTCDALGLIICWDAELGSIIWRFQEDCAILRLSTTSASTPERTPVYVAYGLEDGRVIVRDQRGRTISDNGSHRCPVTAIAIGAGVVLSGAIDGTLHFRSLIDHDSWTRELSYPASALRWIDGDGAHFAVAQEDGTLKTLGPRGQWEGTEQSAVDEEIQGIHDLPGRLLLVTRSGVLVEYRDGHASTIVSTGSVVTASAVTAGDEILVGRASGVVERLAADGGRLLGRVAAHQSWCRTIDTRETPPKILTAGDDGMVRIWDASQSWEPGSGSPLTLQTARQVAFSVDGRELAAVCLDGSVRVWDTNKGELLFESALEAAGSSIAWAREGLAALTETGLLYVWSSLENNSLMRIPTEHYDWPRLIAYTAGGALLVTAGDDGQVFARDSSSLELIGRLQFPRVRFRAFAEVTDDCFVVGGSDGFVCWIRRTAHGMAVDHELQIPGLQAIRTISRAPGSARLLVGDSGGSVVMLDDRRQTGGRWQLKGRVRAATMWDSSTGTGVDSKGWVHSLVLSADGVRARIAERVTSASVSSAGHLAVCTDYGIGILRETGHGSS